MHYLDIFTQVSKSIGGGGVQNGIDIIIFNVIADRIFLSDIPRYMGPLWTPLIKKKTIYPFSIIPTQAFHFYEC